MYAGVTRYGFCWILRALSEEALTDFLQHPGRLACMDRG